MGKLVIGGARSYPKFVVGLLAYFVAFSDIGFGAVLGSIAFTLHVFVGLALLYSKGHFGSQKEVFPLIWQKVDKISNSRFSSTAFS